MTLVIGAVPGAGAPVAERRIFVENTFDEAAACVLGCMLKGGERTVVDFSARARWTMPPSRTSCAQRAARAHQRSSCVASRTIMSGC
jgi:hypothetical protein